jgi:energy-coupling factor transport system ATP-binding protein
VIRAEEFSFTYPVPGGLQKEMGETAFFSNKALNKISLTVEKGDFVLVTGGSGSGKSSLLLALSGMIPHVTGGKIGGTLTIDGRDIRDINPSFLADTTGAAFQNPHTQLFTPTVTEEIAFPLQNRGYSSEEMKTRIGKSLEFTGLTGLEQRNPRKLSGGEKQRLLLAVLLAWDPPVYLLDEPLSALDPVGAEDMMALLTRLNREQGKTIVLAEKGREGNHKVFSRILHMKEGFLIDDHTEENTIYGNNDGCHGSVDFTDLPVLELSQIGFSYTSAPPLFRDFSLTLNPGEVIALTGVNGAGKTTLASLVMGLIKPSHGKIMLGKKDLTPLSVSRRSSFLGYLFQNPDHQLFCSTVREEVFFGREKGANRYPIDHTLAFFGLTGFADLPPALLSFAMRKRVALASVYIRNTPYVILDEPDWGQDKEGLDSLIRYVREERAKGKGFLLISHNRLLVEALADREISLTGGAL